MASKKAPTRPRAMTRAEAKRRVCDGTATLLDGHLNAWLDEANDGSPLSEDDAARMHDACAELVAELRRRAARGAK